VRLLLDTQSLLALLSDDFPLSTRARETMRRPGSELIVSVVNVWEIAIKRSIGKLDAPADLLDRVKEAGAQMLSITADHAQATAALPLHHRDPFDRLLIAQAQIEGYTIVTGDGAFAAYDVPIAW
jgi:PIN domain nuclease of toxin-antitoxin system